MPLRLIIALILLLVVGPAEARWGEEIWQQGLPFHYYVDSVNGSDSHTGKSPAQAFKTIAALPADISNKKIGLKCGSTFREGLGLDTGTVVKAYGLGKKPIISGADLLANASFTKTAGQTNVYEIALPSIPTETNSYASVTCNDVLMVWEDNVRLGGRFENNQTTVAGVDGAAGSFFWDSAAKILYVHASDSSDVTANGKVYEGSTRTLAIHGGDRVYVENLIGEKAYAKSTVGQQGYGILAYKAGTYKKSIGRRCWNHCVGVANQEYGDVLFSQVSASDMENITAPAPGTLFVGYKAGGLAPNPKITFSQCYAKQPARHATIQNTGFYGHGADADNIYDSLMAENLYYGISLYTDGTTVNLSGSHTILTCLYGVRAITNGVTIANVTGKNIPNGGALILNGSKKNITYDNIKSVDSIGAGGGIATSGGTAGDTITVQNSYFIRETETGAVFDYGIQSPNNIRPIISNCSFYNIGTAVDYFVSASDYNNFYSNIRLFSNNTDYTPSYYTTLAAWQAASGMDAHSTATNPNYPASFFEVTITDPSGGEDN